MKQKNQEPFIFVLMQWEFKQPFGVLERDAKRPSLTLYLQYWLYEWFPVHMTELFGKLKQVKPYIISIFLFLNLVFI